VSNDWKGCCGIGVVYARTGLAAWLNVGPVKSNGTGLHSTDLDLRRMIALVPNASPSRSIAMSAALGFFSRAMTSFPLTFVRYGRLAGMIVSFSDSSESSLLRVWYLERPMISVGR